MHKPTTAQINKLSWYLPLLTVVFGVLGALLLGGCTDRPAVPPKCGVDATMVVSYSTVRLNPVANSFAVIVYTSDEADHDVTWRLYPYSAQITDTTHTEGGVGRTDDLAVSKWGGQPTWGEVISIDGCSVE